jgi:hypothetical protein
MRADIVASAVFPDYELIDHTGKRRKLSDLQGPDPMVLVLSRGGYLICHSEMECVQGCIRAPLRSSADRRTPDHGRLEFGFGWFRRSDLSSVLGLINSI